MRISLTIHEKINCRSAMGGCAIFLSAIEWGFEKEDQQQPVMARKWVSGLTKKQRHYYFNCK